LLVVPRSCYGHSPVSRRRCDQLAAIQALVVDRRHVVVVHFQSPDSPVTYYQQIGRAGRALDRAEVVLLCGAEDRSIWEWFASTAFPPRDQVATVLDALEAAGGRYRPGCWRRSPT
jgi:hypothetical protein